MTKKIVISVMVIDDKYGAKPEYFENTSISINDASSVNALQQVQQWVSEQVVCAKVESIK